ncbi:unnamed protein product [Victoria cruziana]
MVIKRKGSATQPPTPAGRLPVIGHLHMLSSGSQKLKETLSGWHEKYGPVLMIRLGLRRVLVVSSWEMAKECFTTNDLAFSNRPRSAAAKYMTDEFNMFACPYGEYWRKMRKIATVEMLSVRRIESFRDIRTSEIDSQVSRMYRLWLANDRRPATVDVKKMLEELTFNTVVRTVAGEDYVVGRGKDDDKSREFARCTKELVNLFLAFVVSDFFPFLEVLDINGWIGTMKKVARNVDAFVGECVAEHRRRRKATSGDDSGHDFIDVLLSRLSDDEGPNGDAVIKSTAMSMMTGGNDATASAMVQALYMLLLHPHTLKKVQEELDLHVGKDRTVNESDLQNLVYLQAAVKEALRLVPPTPLLALRESLEDCLVGGFHVPAGTRLMVNLWRIHHDPRVWDDPEAFRPERFLGSDVDVRGQHFQYLPFGSGRRICPGISLALRMVQIALARLLHGFDLQLHPDSRYDGSSRLGSGTVLKVLLAPRLVQGLYG